jgi:membrane fusion protein, multidrug efflux system
MKTNARNVRQHAVLGSKGWVGGWGVLVFAALPLGTGCTQPQPDAVEAVRPVKTMVIAEGENTTTRSFPGRVDAANRVQLAFQVPGLLASLPVREGQTVAKGDVIAALREDEFQARLTALQGQLDQARAALGALLAGDRPEERLRRQADVRAAEQRLANARAEYERYARLIASRAVSRSDYERAETVLRIAEEDLVSARQLLEIGVIARQEDIDAQQGVVRGLEGRVVEASLNLQDCTLRAPYDGVIAERFVEEGQNVTAKQPIVKFQDIDEVEIAVDVPEAVMAANLQAADIVKLDAEISGAPGIRFPVRVTEMGQRADPTTQTFNVRVGMKSPEGINVLPGMTATVTMTYRRAAVLGRRIMVPVAAVYQDNSGEAIVWALEDDKVSRRAVTVGATRAGEVEITDGLQPGDQIVIAGVNRLRDGMRVRDLGADLGGRSQ